jgi:Ohr subfamily peroxiredoxin
MLIDKVLYRARIRATSGRETRAVSPDGALDLKLSTPRELGGASGRGTNPEQLFAASYAASFLGIMRLLAARGDMVLPRDTAVEAVVGIGSVREGFGIEVELRISLPGLPRADVDSLAERSHAICPYSNATRGNVPVRLVIA